MDLFSARAQQHCGNRGIKSSTADGLAFGMFGVCIGILSLGFLYIPHATFPNSDATIVIMSARSYGPTCRAVFSVVWTYSRAFRILACTQTGSLWCRSLYGLGQYPRSEVSCLRNPERPARWLAFFVRGVAGCSSWSFSLDMLTHNAVDRWIPKYLTNMEGPWIFV